MQFFSSTTLTVLFHAIFAEPQPKGKSGKVVRELKRAAFAFSIVCECDLVAGIPTRYQCHMFTSEGLLAIRSVFSRWCIEDLSRFIEVSKVALSRHLVFNLFPYYFRVFYH